LFASVIGDKSEPSQCIPDASEQSTSGRRLSVGSEPSNSGRRPSVEAPEQLNLERRPSVDATEQLTSGRQLSLGSEQLTFGRQPSVDSSEQLNSGRRPSVVRIFLFFVLNFYLITGCIQDVNHKKTTFII